MPSAFVLRGRQEDAAPGSLRLGTPRVLSGSRRLRLVVIALGAIGATAFLACFVAAPLMLIRHVVVQSDMPLADDQVLALSGITGTEHWYSVSTPAIEKRLEANALIRRARVEKVFPGTLRMTVWGREAAAVVLASSGGRTVPVLVDGDGVVFKIGTTSADVDLPVIAGISAGETALGAGLPGVYAPLFGDLRALRQSAPSLFDLVSEVRIVAPTRDRGEETGEGLRNAEAAAPGAFDMLLYLTASPVAVRVRGAIDESLLKYTLMTLDLLSRQGVLKDIQELDFRSGDVVYKLRGAATR